MNLFKMIYSYLYYLFVKMTYRLSRVEDKKEEIYHNSRKCQYFIAVKDAEVGKRLYEVINALKLRVINIPCAGFKFTKYGLSPKKSVRWFSIEGFFLGGWDNLSKLDKLRRIQSFVDVMQTKGFVLDDTKFNNNFGNSVSEFLSFFIQSNEEEKIERSKGCMIRYIHYVCSNGGELNEFFERLCENGLSEEYNIPYNSLVARMCYEYFKTGTTPDSISDALAQGTTGKYESYSLVAIRDILETKFEVTEKNDKYTIYDGCLKIYQNMSSEYENFLANDDLIAECKKTILEPIEAIIVDLDNHIIGYKFAKEYEQNQHDVFEPTSQNEIFDYVMDMVHFLEGHCSNAESKDFEIEKCLVYTGLSENYYTFACKTIEDWFNLTINNENMLNQQITAIFFKLFANYMAKTYGELTSKKQFLEKIEVRYLSPIVVREFVNFALGKAVDYQVASKELFELFDNRAVSHQNASISYDARFCYDPLTVNFAFDYEAKDKYNVKLVKGTTEKLPDGRFLVIFKKSRNISVFVHQEESAEEDVISTINGADEQVSLIGISEILVGTERLNKDNMYNIIGYVSEPIKGEQLTDEVLLSLNNRDLLKVAAYLFARFNTVYIPWKFIWMDKDFKFYINYMDEDYQSEKSTRESIRGIFDNASFVQWVFDYLAEKGYNPNAFVGWKIPRGGYNESKQYLLDLANKFDAYCDEHEIYYESKFGQCPVCSKTRYFVPDDFDETFVKVFEDSVAVHYSIDKEYNLKVYKAPFNTQLEENVSRLVPLRLTYEDADLGLLQDCFLPCKRAVDNKNQFVGYVYDAAKFEVVEGNTSDVCVDLENGENLKNLPRLRSLIRLMLQVREITNKKMGFVMNPFSHVFLNTSHKKQVQILNVEFIAPCNQVDLIKTKQWTCDYIYKVLKSDPTIEFKKTVLPEGFDTLLSRLSELSRQMSEYCPIHKMHYKRSYKYCPKCIDPNNPGESILYTSRSRYNSEKYVGEGGEAFIYPHSMGTVAKVFKEGEINKAFKNNILFRILAKKDMLEEINKENHKFKYVIPKQILIDSYSDEIFGYIMEWIDNAFPISDLKDKTKVKDLRFSRKDVLEIIITIGEGIEALHKLGIYIGDLNGRNILFDAQKNVYFLDFDGMGVDEVAPEFCTDGYIDPLSKKNQKITMKDDWYSFALQAFYYLTYTHPFNGIYEIEVNGNKVKLEIPDKMERRISLLGNHGMKAPAIAESWVWMNDELQFAFLDIFEGDYRESIVPLLKNQYESQYQTLFKNVGVNKSPKIVYRMNSKFVAKKLDIFVGRVVRVLKPYAAICEKGDYRYLELLTKSNGKVDLFVEKYQNSDLQKISDVLLSDDEKLAFVVYSNEKVLVVDLRQKSVIYAEPIPDATNVVVNEQTMYFTRISRENMVVSNRSFLPNGEVTKENYGFGNLRIKYFNVKFNTKFILLMQATANCDELYCNSEKFFTFEYDSADIAEQAKYNVLYDNATKSWLVVNNFGKALVIKMSGEKSEIDISKYVNDVNLANIHFEKGNIYIPNQESLYIVNVNSNVTKKMECSRIMRPESRVYDINSNGFSVITLNSLYEVRKG